MVLTQVKHILFPVECYMGNWDMKVGAIDPHHRELQANMSGHGHVAYAPFIVQFLCFYEVPPQIGNLPINGACATQTCVMIYRFEAPGDTDLVHPASFLYWSLNVR